MKYKSGEKFCGKCGEIVEFNDDKKQEENIQNHSSKNKKIFILPIIIIVILAIVIAVVFYLFFNKQITDEYLIQHVKQNGFEQFDDFNLKILAIKDIEYDNFDKLVLNRMTITDQGTKVNYVGILLVNRKEDNVMSFTTNNSFNYLLKGLCNNRPNTVDTVATICAKYLQENGTEMFNNISSAQFKSLIKELSNIVPISESRNYVTAEMQNLNSSLNATLLFEKESAFVKYIAFYEQVSKYNWPVAENIAQYYYKTNRKTYYNLELIYGPAYTMVNQYTVYSTETGDINNFKEVGSYTSLETARNKLNVD